MIIVTFSPIHLDFQKSFNLPLLSVAVKNIVTIVDTTRMVSELRIIFATTSAWHLFSLINVT